MKLRRRVFPLVVLLVLASSIVPFAQNAPNKDEKKRDDAQKKEIQSIVKIVDDAAAGQPAANDLAISWVREDVLKAQGNKEYVPFTVSIDASKVTTPNVAFYWRVVSKNAAAPMAAVPGDKDKKDDKKKDDKNKKPDYAYEDISFVPVQAGQTAMKIARSNFPFASPCSHCIRAIGL